MSRIDLGFCWNFPGCEPEIGLSSLREYGFDGVELWPQFLDEWGVGRWQKALLETNMRCLQLCPYFDFVSGDAKIADSRLSLDNFLGMAKLLDCDRLRVFTGPPWGGGVVDSRAATPAQWDAAITHLREFCKIAASRNVELCLECHEGTLMEDWPSTLRLLNAVNQPNLTVNLQLPLRDEDWRVSLRELGRFTHHIHIHNWTNGIGGGEITFLDAGNFDWAPAIKSLTTQNDFTLCLSVEHPTHGGHDDAWESARRDGAFLQSLRAEHGNA